MRGEVIGFGLFEARLINYMVRLKGPGYSIVQNGKIPGYQFDKEHLFIIHC